MAACPGKKWYPVGKEKAGRLLDLVLKFQLILLKRMLTMVLTRSLGWCVQWQMHADARAPAVLCVAEPCWARIPACLFRAMIVMTDDARPSFPALKAQKRTPPDAIFQLLVFLYSLNPGTHACEASASPLSHNPSHRVISKYCVG